LYLIKVTTLAGFDLTTRQCIFPFLDGLTFFSVMEWLSPKNDGLFGDGRVDILKRASNGELGPGACHAYNCSQPISHDFIASS
jgi:hypothetical protein